MDSSDGNNDDDDQPENDDWFEVNDTDGRSGGCAVSNFGLEGNDTVEILDRSSRGYSWYQAMVDGLKMIDG